MIEDQVAILEGYEIYGAILKSSKHVPQLSKIHAEGQSRTFYGVEAEEQRHLRRMNWFGRLGACGALSGTDLW